jgi:hypothetical protein
MATLEKQPVMEGKRLHMVLTPGATHKVKANIEEKKELQNAEVKNA